MLKNRKYYLIVALSVAVMFLLTSCWLSLPSDPSELSGVVFDDLNADGVMDPGEPPLKGVKLELGDGTCALASVSQTTNSAADGSYQFTLPSPSAGTYCVKVDPLKPPNDTKLIPGDFTIPSGGEFVVILTDGENVMDIPFGWDYQFAGTDLQSDPDDKTDPDDQADPDLQSNPVITNVTLSTKSPPDGGFVEVEVTIKNKGDYPAENYELVLIPHYGVGPPNPAGYVTLPDLQPGVPHTEVFSPGVLYTPAGTYTLRVLVTDDWYALGDPDSTGTSGDYQDFSIEVQPDLSNCNPFESVDVSMVLLGVNANTLVLPIYLKTGGENIPGLAPPEDPPWQYYAMLGGIESNKCELQGFDDRLYCIFNLTKDFPGKAITFKLYLNQCKEPVFTQLHALIPRPKCSKTLTPDGCCAAGGTYKTDYCECPK